MLKWLISLFDHHCFKHVIRHVLININNLRLKIWVLDKRKTINLKIKQFEAKTQGEKIILKS